MLLKPLRGSILDLSEIELNTIRQGLLLLTQNLYDYSGEQHLYKEECIETAKKLLNEMVDIK